MKYDTVDEAARTNLTLGAWRALPADDFEKALKDPPFPFAHGPLAQLLGDLEREHIQAVALEPYQPQGGRAEELEQRAAAVRAALKKVKE